MLQNLFLMLFAGCVMPMLVQGSIVDTKSADRELLPGFDGESRCGHMQATFFAPPARTPRVFTIDGDALRELRERIRRTPENYRVALTLLTDQVAAYLDTEPWTVTKKTVLPPSGDPHDYESQGPYWWPNPKTSDGLPYIRRDGEKNPEIDKLSDHRQLYAMTTAVKKLSLAYFLTGDGRFADKAALFLRTWFLDPDTKMDPHLEYGQRIPGITDGRGIGIIETRILGDIADAVGLIEGSKEWSRSDEKGMRDWMAQYLDWLLNSEHGKDEARQRNNHGTWYDVQVVSLALFTNKNDIARQAILRVRDERLPGHIEPDGRQPHELARTRSWNYSIMNLQSFFTLATLGEKIGIDLWHYSTPDGRSIAGALDYLASFVNPRERKAWEYEQITGWNASEIVPLLFQAACRFPEKEYATLAAALEKGEPSLHKLLYPCSSQ